MTNVLRKLLKERRKAIETEMTENFYFYLKEAFFTVLLFWERTLLLGNPDILKKLSLFSVDSCLGVGLEE